ncbi:hypothetical protein P8T57_05585 [Thalassospira sp. SN3W]|uniref:hypothetical protein n=1 Tax=Thalassospira sp. SN3W TaxID=3035476 RepID=UPI00311B1A96
MASNDANTLINLDIDCRINMIAALGWSGVAHIERLFNAGYSKVFFGGARRAVPSEREEQIFREMVRIYGASSFGYSMHFPCPEPYIPKHLSDSFNEVLIIDSELQLLPDPDRTAHIAHSISRNMPTKGKEINFSAPHINYEHFEKCVNFPVNYVNYCEHGIAKYR